MGRPAAGEWQQSFDHHAPVCLQNESTRNTVAEADFIAEVLGLRPGDRVLDVG